VIVDLAIDSENNFIVVTDKRLGSGVWIAREWMNHWDTNAEKHHTNADYCKTFVCEDAALADITARPIGTTMSQPFREGDEPCTVLTRGLVQSMNGKDTTHVACR